MAEKTLDARVCLKYDTYERWKSKNTVLKKGEVAQTYVSSTSTIDSTGKTLTASSSGTIPAGSVLYKVGDGTTAYNSLKFTTAIPTDAAPKSHTHGEATLTFGGENLYPAWGKAGYSPVDASMIPTLGANRFAFMPTSGYVIEYSRDNGETWTEYTSTEEKKINLFNGVGGYGFGIGGGGNAGIDKSAWQLRITITTNTARVYTQLNKFCLYVTTNGSTGCWCTIDGKTKANVDSGTDTWKVFADKATIAGWSGWNVINTELFTTYGNQSYYYQKLRFTFGVTSHASTVNYTGLTVSKIMGFGGVGWTSPSTLALEGRLYTYDYLQNATFPAKVKATSGFDGGLLGTNNTTNADSYVWFSAQSTANEANASYMGKRAYNAKLKYNPSTDVLTVGSITGSAASATKATQDGNGNVIADTYVKKVTTTDSFNRVYAISSQGAPVMMTVANGSAHPNSIAQRYNDGRLLVGTPKVNNDATTKKYVDDAISSNTLSAGAGITIADKIISLDYDTLNSDSISSSNGQLSVNTSYIANNICGNGLYVDGCNSVLSVNWESIPIDANGPIYFGSCNQGLNLTYGNGLKVESYNGLCVDWSQLPINSSTFYIDSSGLQITRPNNILDIGLGNYTT